MTPRSLADVIDRLLPILRENGVNTADLEKIRQSVGFTAPEVMGVRWRLAQDWLADNVPEDAEWQPVVVAIWNGRQEPKERP